MWARVLLIHHTANLYPIVDSLASFRNILPRPTHPSGGSPQDYNIVSSPPKLELITTKSILHTIHSDYAKSTWIRRAWHHISTIFDVSYLHVTWCRVGASARRIAKPQEAKDDWSLKSNVSFTQCYYLRSKRTTYWTYTRADRKIST